MAERAQRTFRGELGERRRLVVASIREALDRLGREHVVAAVDPERDLAALAEAVHDVVVVDVDEPELRLRLRDGDRRLRATRAMCGEQSVVVDVDELVAVQRVHVAVLPAPLRRELDAAAAPEALRLLRRDDLRTEAGELGLEERPLAGGAGEDHARHARVHEPPDLVRGERLPGELDERLRPSGRSVTEPLGFAAGEDDRFHGRYASWGSRSGVSGRTSVGEIGRPMPS